VTTRRTGRTIAQAIALLILGVIGSDLGDVACDPLRLGLGDAILSPASAAATDACADLCLPDCFCCAPTVAAALPEIAGAPCATLAPSPLLAEPATSGFSLPIEHIPLASL